MTESIPCARPFGCADLPLDGDWVQVDIPDMPALAFCGLNCLSTWVNYVYWPPERRPTSFIQPRPLKVAPATDRNTEGDPVTPT